MIPLKGLDRENAEKMNKKKIGLIGVGTVGGAFLEELSNNRIFIKKNLELDISVAKICDTNPKIRKLASKYKIPFTKKAEDIIDDPGIDIVVELIGGLDPAKKFVIKSLENKKDIVTANKALLATHGRQIFELAYQMDKTIGFEAAVAGAIPLVKSISEALRFGEIKSLYGILNGTTNFVLTQMEREKKSYDDILAQAVEKGIAEKDPTLDVSGKDSLHKIALLCFLCFGKFPVLKGVLLEGIENITTQDIIYAKELGYSIKLLAIAKKNKDIQIRVHPALVDKKHPISKINGVLNSAFINTKSGGEFLFSGLGAGGNPTALSVLSDVITACGQKRFYALRESKGKRKFKKFSDLAFRYYLRISALDQPGVLSKVSKILSEYKISIASVSQKDDPFYYAKRRYVPLVMVTHLAKESQIQKAVQRIDRLSQIKSRTQLIRIEKL